MLHISLFSGIGGFDLAAQWMGWTNIVSCEINDFGNQVLEHYWPNAYHHRDVKTLTLEKINQQLGNEWRTDDVILTGGFPCQPYSSAGKRKGKEDERHLWPEMLRVIREVAPSYILGENVAGLLSWSGGLVFDEVHADLEAEGYEVQAVVIPAAAVNAPHGRDRVWFVAFKDTNENGRGSKQWEEECSERKLRNTCTRDNERLPTDNDKIRTPPHTNSNGLHSSDRGHEEQPSEGGEYAQRDTNEGDSNGIVANTGGRRIQGHGGSSKKQQLQTTKFDQDNSEKFKRMGWDSFPTVSPVCSRNDGLSHHLDGITFSKWRNESIKAAGNAVVPQVVFEIFKAIEATRK